MRFALLLLLLPALACQRPDELSSSGALLHPASADSSLVAAIRGPDLVLANRDTVPLYYMILDAELATRIEWAPCTDPNTCDQIAPGDEHAFSLATLHADTLLVFWWRLVPAPAGNLQPDSVRHIALRFE